MREPAIEGVIVKGIGGFYYVDDGERVHTCKARGRFRKLGLTPMVGDGVRVLPNAEGDALIDDILPRRNAFIRPPIANVEQFVVVAALAQPAPASEQIDRFLIMAEHRDADVVVCLNKVDLVDEQTVQEWIDIYRPLYPVVTVSGRTGSGIGKLAEYLAGRQSALAGPSGVGKSTLLNRLLGESVQAIGAVADKTGRGRHTTRHVELFRVASGRVFDTPGFSSFDVLEASPEELASLFPEMEARAGTCRYDNCRHLAEPDCRVRRAVAEGQIAPSRYASYCRMMKELRGKRK